MNNTKNMMIGLLAACLCALGCDGGGGGDGQDASTGNADPQATSQPGEVVVEPSAETITVDGDEVDTLELIRELLTADAPEVAVPIGYTLTIDEAFEQAGRLRFVIGGEEGIDAITDESIADSADEVYEELARVFAERAEAAMQGELASLRDEAMRANERTRELQADIREFLANRRGLPSTGEVQQQRLRMDQLLNRSLDKEVELDKQVQLMARALERKKWATLTRIR